MPRTLPLEEFERAICARARQARERAKIKQADLARGIGIHPDRLAGYEHGRSPLPYSIAAGIAQATDTCQRWLFNGSPPECPYLPVDEIMSDPSWTNARFSLVYANLLNREVKEQLSVAAKDSEVDEAALRPEHLKYYAPLHSPTELHQRVRFEVQLDRLRALASRLDTGKLIAFTMQLGAVERKLHEGHERDGNRWTMTAEDERSKRREALLQMWAHVTSELRRVGEAREKPEVDESAKTDNDAHEMPPSLLQDTLEIVRQRTSHPGGQSTLAKEIGVDRQRVSDWLKGRVEPNGEMALRLRDWVARTPEINTKKPARVTARTGEATRTAKSKSNEKDQSTRRELR